MKKIQSSDHHLWSTSSIAKMAIVTSLYVVITMFLSVISFGAVQLRVAELFNYLGIYHKRYIYAVTLGVAIANFFSPFGILDVVIGSLSTFLVLNLSYFVTQKIMNEKVRLMITALLVTFSMFTIAAELHFISDLPFFLTWLSVAFGELCSMIVGGILIYWIRKKTHLF